MKTLPGRLIIIFIIALILTILPMPTLLFQIRPPWILMLLLFLQFYLPEYFNLFILFVLGLVLDVLLSTVIGEHAFALLIVSWLASSKARRFSFFSLGQQMVLIGFLSLLYQLILVVIDAFLGIDGGMLRIVSSALISSLLWPWIKLLAEDTLYLPRAAR